MKQKFNTRISLLVGLLLLSGCASSDGTARTDPDAFWEANRNYGADEVEPYLPIGEMMATADAVVVGHFGEVQGTRPLHDIHYLQIELVIDELISGDVDTDSVTLEFLGGASSESSTTSVELPSGPMLVLLRLKDSDVDPPDTWRVTNSMGLWTQTERAQIDTPLNEYAPEQDDHNAELVQESEDIEDFIATARSL